MSEPIRCVSDRAKIAQTIGSNFGPPLRGDADRDDNRLASARRPTRALAVGRVEEQAVRVKGDVPRHDQRETPSRCPAASDGEATSIACQIRWVLASRPVQVDDLGHQTRPFWFSTSTVVRILIRMSSRLLPTSTR